MVALDGARADTSPLWGGSPRDGRPKGRVERLAETAATAAHGMVHSAHLASESSTTPPACSAKIRTCGSSFNGFRACCRRRLSDAPNSRKFRRASVRLSSLFGPPHTSSAWSPSCPSSSHRQTRQISYAASSDRVAYPQQGQGCFILCSNRSIATRRAPTSVRCRTSLHSPPVPSSNRT